MGGGQDHHGVQRVARLVWDYIPQGNTLDDESFRQRHQLLCWILAAHLPALFAYGVWQGFGIEHSAIEIATPTALLVFAQLARNRRVAAFFVTAGLVFCSSVLVHLSNGTIEAHFHFFILIGLIALYQDWVPFLWNVVFTVLSHGLGSAVAADLMYNHAPAQNRPWSWAFIHGVAVLAACVGVIIFWKNTEIAQRRSTTLAGELAAAQTQAAQRESVSELFVNLARRNQSLLDRQLELISELEELKRTPEALDELFQLDHLATRIRRNAESLLVLSGDDPPRRWGRPVPLSEVVRAAAAEVEEYRRVDVLVSEHLEIAGRAVADLAHLLAELIENATRYSPKTSEVKVRSYPAPGRRTSFVLSVEDSGIGMTEADIQAANALLADPPDIDLRARTLGLRVVGRLADRYRLEVSLAHTPGGGTTALVSLPPDLVGERQPLRPKAASAPAGEPTGPVETPPWIAPRRQDPSPSHLAPTPLPSRPQQERTADGLVRRVPGAALSPVLRQRARHVAVRDHNPPSDRDGMRSMLSRFQASQRAGRAIAVAPDGSLAPGSEPRIVVTLSDPEEDM